MNVTKQVKQGLSVFTTQVKLLLEEPSHMQASRTRTQASAACLGSPKTHSLLRQQYTETAGQCILCSLWCQACIPQNAHRHGKDTAMIQKKGATSCSPGPEC